MTSPDSPLIEVGILLAETVHINLKGTFHVRGENGSLSGEAEAEIVDGSIRITHNGKEALAGEPIVLDPAGEPGGPFLIRNVVIGIGFHWEQKEDQEFRGALKLMVSGDKIQVVNLIDVEHYLISVISSEMRGDSSPALLKAHTLISRSWLLAQIEKKNAILNEASPYSMIHESEGAYIRWYDREDHEEFHVCADDHCQRYQGITRAYNPEVVKAVLGTAGEVLIYGGNICDARFSKCCGGVVETFENCWEPVPHPYLQRVDDNPAAEPANTADLKIEANAIRFIQESPPAFCNTRDDSLLRQVLNDYDQSSKDFYRWKKTYRQAELSVLIREKSRIDFGQILDLHPVERGESGRLVKLKITGSKKALTIGKELEIRRWLDRSHLYSSAFWVEKKEVTEGVPGVFILHGAGWGHGVGLCQIGAAVMADRGYSHQEILAHYFVDATIEKRYE